jgi:DNA uptake protein ComE-like DNA-binding protein
MRQGSVLLLVLVVLAMLTLGTATYLELMQNEQRAVRHHGRGVQAVRLAESGVEYVKTLLAATPAEISQTGGLTSNPAAMQAAIVDDPGDEFDRGRFTIVAPAQIDGLYAGVRFGLENESGKLNLNVLLAPGAEQYATTRLLALPGMTPEVADAILDWIDPDDAPREMGAEQETYSQLALYGLDQNCNFLLEATEQPRGLLMELDNTDGSLNRGWSAYLTVSSVEGWKPPVGQTLINLNSPNLQQLYNDLKAAIGDEKAKFIILYRQYGAQQQGLQNGLPGSTPGGPTGPVQPGGGPNLPGQAPGGGPGPVSQSAGATVPITSIQLKFEQQGGHQLNSPLDLVAARVQVPSENPGQPSSNSSNQTNGQQQSGEGPPSGGQPQNQAPPQIVESQWLDNPAAYRELLTLYDIITPAGVRRVAGRVNVNAASRPVLQSIPLLPPAAVGAIVGRRELEPDPALSDQRHALWLLAEGIVTLQEMKQLERFVTAGGDVFSGQAVGFFDAGPIAARVEFVIDRSGASPHLRAWRDLSSLGRGFSTELLGVAPAESP